MKYGMDLVKNKKINDQVLVEGVYALKAAKILSTKLDIDTPIINSINDIVHKKEILKLLFQNYFLDLLRESFNKLESFHAILAF